MIWLTALLCGVLLIMAYLLFAPFYIEVNSLSNLYRLRFHRLMSLSLKSNTDGWAVELKILFWKKHIRFTGGPGKDDKKPEPASKPSSKMPAIDLKKIIRVLKSFDLKVCDISLDTGHMPLNGILYPLVYMTGAYYRREISINFAGHNHVILEIENNLAKIIYAYYKS